MMSNEMMSTRRGRGRSVRGLALKAGGTAALMLLAAAAGGCSDDAGDDGPNAAASCGSDERVPPSAAAPARASTALAFATVDRNYSSSRLWLRDLASGETQELLTGEGGDPAVKSAGERLYFFNRKAAALNMRSFDPRDGGSGAAAAAQLAVPEAGNGDPHAVVELDGGRLLLAHYNAGELAVVCRDSGALVETVDADWDFRGATDAQLRPEALLVRDTSAGRRIYVLHQGRDKSQFAPDGSQQVFVLADDGAHVTAVDRDEAADGVQGMPLTFANPEGFFDSDPARPEVLIGGACNEYDPAGCRFGFERLDLDSGTSTPLAELTDSGYRDNGGLVDAGGGKLYALLSKPTGTKAPSDKLAVRIDSVTGEITPVHRFPKDSAGCCALFYDAGSATLLVGDSTAAGDGTWTKYVDDVQLGMPEPVSGIPYTGSFVPQAAQ
jgi:hypothetical protein